MKTQTQSTTSRAIALCLAGASLFSASAHAQSNVTIYGIIDAGVGYISNDKGSANYEAITGTIQNNRLGFRGTEDLGGGTKAIFTLENGFSTTTGAAGQGGALFGRQAFVGLTDNRYGTLTLGNQYDLLGATLGQYETSGFLLGNYGDHPFGNDRANGLRVSNSVRYMSPTYAGLQVGAMYAFSNAAGNINGTGRSYSYSAQYVNGPWSVGAAFVEVAGTTLDISSLTGRAAGSVVVGGSYLRSFGAGTSYRFSRATVYALYTQALYAGVAGSGVPNTMFRNGHIGFTFDIKPDLLFGGAFTITSVNGIKLNQLSTSLDHPLSVRTDIYTQFFLQHATGTNAHANIINLNGSSSANQIVVTAGIRHKF